MLSTKAYGGALHHLWFQSSDRNHIEILSQKRKSVFKAGLSYP